MTRVIFFNNGSQFERVFRNEDIALDFIRDLKREGIRFFLA